MHDEHRALVVDPGDAQTVLETLQRLDLDLKAILVTHHHADHTGGVAALRNATNARVYGPAREAVPEPLTRLGQGDRVRALGLEFRIMDVPGHTAGHIAYYSESGVGPAPLLFCGDTLFSAGCGRLFEGTPQQMLASLDSLSALPADTRVCCAHEYTLGNLAFACAIDPANEVLRDYALVAREQRRAQRPTLPSTLGLERQINPFLRTREAAIVGAAQGFDPSAREAADVFAALRTWKNEFR